MEKNRTVKWKSSQSATLGWICDRDAPDSNLYYPAGTG